MLIAYISLQDRAGKWIEVGTFGRTVVKAKTTGGISARAMRYTKGKPWRAEIVYASRPYAEPFKTIVHQ